ncbi:MULTISPECIES: transglycosylase domain-containing protein [unclassified Janibacter]|uniref:transglycosylase domain-containing protein n=1 Tax=unclassified Janibacter TaxID=2649294 RepID=UPI003D02937C
MPPRSSMPHVVALLAAFVAIAVGVGLVSAGLLVPVAGAAGTAARSTVKAFDEMPEDFQPSTLGQQSRIMSADGKVVATPYDTNRITVKLNQVAPIMRKAQIAIEDSRFYEHGGIDIRGTARALATNLGSGGVTQGGSSLTQQYVKIMLQEKALSAGDNEAAAAAVSKSYSRKLQELKYALNIEKSMTKDQILIGYLNLVYYGDQAYGVEAASRHYFNKRAKDLKLVEAATLAGIVQSPGTTDPVNNPRDAEKRRNMVLTRMYQLGFASEAAVEKAKATKVESYLNVKPNEGGTCTRASDPYFCNYVMAYLKTLPALGENEDERTRNINQGGLTIKTTLRRDWQKKMREDLTELVPTGDASGVGAAAATIEPGTGKVLAIAQTSEFKTGLTKSSTKYTEQGWSVPTAMGGTRGFAIGSTAKVYALVTALQKGMPLSSEIDAPFADTKKAHEFDPSEFERTCTAQKPWPVKNDYPIGGKMSLAKATAESINTAFAQLASQVGSCKIRDTMKKMGLKTGAGTPYGAAPTNKDEYPISNLVLGSDDSTPLSLANSYATLAADGIYCPTTPIESITTAAGKKIKLPKTKCERVMDEDVARGVTKLLRGPIETGTATAAKLADGRVAAGKTGTTDNHNQSWFVGYTPQLATSVWVGQPFTGSKAMPHTIGGRNYGGLGIFGGTIAAPLWKSVMDDLSSDMEKKSFTEPSAKIIEGDLRDIPNVVGMPTDQAMQMLEDAGFKAQVVQDVNSNYGAGTVAYTDPSGRAIKGAMIGIYRSNGIPEYTPPPPPTTTAPPAPTTTAAPTTTTKPSTTTTKKPTSTSSTTTKKKGKGNGG